MKPYFTLALIPGLVFGPAVQADNESPQNLVILNSFATNNCPTIPVQCETPVIACPAPQIVRRIVPRTTYQTVIKTSMVPTTVMETRQVESVEYRNEVRERSVTVYEQVPETKQVTTEHTVLVPTTRQRTETVSVQVPYERLVRETYAVDNIQTETRTRKQLVSRDVPSTELRTTIADAEVVKRSRKSELGGVRAHLEIHGSSKTEELVTETRPQLFEQTIAYDVQVNRPKMCTRMVKQTAYRTELQTRTVPETVHVPKVELRTHQVNGTRSVPRQRTESVNVQVPYTVTRQVQVPVTKMVPQQFIEQVPVTTYDVVEELISN